MKTSSHERDFVHMPADLLAQAQAAADEEHRTMEELVREALLSYLESRRSQQREHEPPRKNLAQLLMESPFAGTELDLERRKDYTRPTEL